MMSPGIKDDKIKTMQNTDYAWSHKHSELKLTRTLNIKVVDRSSSPLSAITCNYHKNLKTQQEETQTIKVCSKVY